MQTNKLPSIFISHGDVGLTLDAQTDYHKSLKKFSSENQLQEKVKTIIVLSAHWQAQNVSINVHPSPQIIHDHPFKQLFKYKFRMETNIELAKQIKSSLENNQIKTSFAQLDQVDHGVWGVVYALFDIDKQQQFFTEKKQLHTPKIVQVSLHSGMDTAFHYKLGQVLSLFRNEQTMIITSGSTTHSWNIMRNPSCIQTSHEWEKWLAEVISNKDEQYRKDQLFSIKENKFYSLMQDTDDHFIPLLVSLGTSPNPGKLLVQGTQHGILLCSCFVFD